VEFAATAGQLLIGRGNRLGALLFDRRVRTILPPASGRTSLLRLVARLEKEAEAPAEPTDLGRALIEAAHLMRRPSLILLITDFMTADGWQKPLRSLGIRHEVVALWVADPREREIPDVGVVTFEDPETGRQLVVDTRDARLRARFQHAAAEQREAIRSELRRCRVSIAELGTQAELVPQMVRFIRERESQRARPVAGARQ
jgi:uncharacterized protein (DUF58 family)